MVIILPDYDDASNVTLASLVASKWNVLARYVVTRRRRLSIIRGSTYLGVRSQPESEFENGIRYRSHRMYTVTSKVGYYLAKHRDVATSVVCKAYVCTYVYV